MVAGAGAPYSAAGGIIGIIDIMGIPRPDFLTSWATMNPSTRVMASLDRIRAFMALRPIRATKIGIRAFILSFSSSSTGSRSFFFSK